MTRTDEWPTPQWLVDQLADEFGPFDLDPAAAPGNAKAPAFYTMTDDGLAREWRGRVWLNPPYGRNIGAWTQKAAAEAREARASIVVALVPASVDAAWFRQAAADAALVRFWPGRIHSGDGDRAPFLSALLVFGTLPGRHGTTPAWCAAPSCGRVFWPARRDARTCSAACRKALSRVTPAPPKRDAHLGGRGGRRGRAVTAYTVAEICAGAGGQSLGLEGAGLSHVVTVEIDPDACRTLLLNRPQWNVAEADVHHFDGRPYSGVDVLAGGVPCPPFSVAGKQLGADDERDLFPQALRLVRECEPRAVMLENVPGLAQAKFAGYREQVLGELLKLGYQADWQVLNARDFGVPQLRPRFILVAMRPELFAHFEWPSASGTPPTVGEALHDLMAGNGWKGADEWARRANSIGPTLVGGSRKHGGPDLGPTRAREAWRKLGVDGRGLADAPPPADAPADYVPRLTRDMTAVIQGFPPDWQFSGRKTTAYRQIGNAFPPPVARAVGEQIRSAFDLADAIASDRTPAALTALAEDPAVIFLAPRHALRPAGPGHERGEPQ
jgi:DNA (cytosine-5)-methyltransferase 1